MARTMMARCGAAASSSMRSRLLMMKASSRWCSKGTCLQSVIITLVTFPNRVRHPRSQWLGHIFVCAVCVCAGCLLSGVIIWPGHIYTHTCIKPHARTCWDPCIYTWLFLPSWKQMHAAQTVISYPLQASCVFHGQIHMNLYKTHAIILAEVHSLCATTATSPSTSSVWAKASLCSYHMMYVCVWMCMHIYR